ncbi:MAG: FAD-dependent oxidoreductase [Clostridia bacterium]|nr:FAD-dependent oxidoreductase [Clostridia bacterium]
MKHDIVIIGAGPAGLAAACQAYDSGVKDIVILEREPHLGGILNQCIHNGFGLKRFGQSLTGPEYAQRYIDMVLERGIKVYTETTVLSLTDNKVITAISPTEGLFYIEAKAVILAMGCRERSRGALNIPGTRPAGVYSAGTAQKYVNIFGRMPGKEVVILGSGDIGLIMARRMTVEGARVHAVAEIMPHSSGLKRNIVQCLDDFDIPLYLNHTITKIEGKDRVEGVVISQVDQNKKPILGTEKHFKCDTVLFSVGLIPENELTKKAGVTLDRATRGAVVDQTRETSVSGVFACGNVLQVHDLVDYVSEESAIAGRFAAEYVLKGKRDKQTVKLSAGENVSYVLPQQIDKGLDGNVKLFFRVTKTLNNCTIRGLSGEKEVFAIKKRVVVPGEMETVILPKDKIELIDGGLTVTICD